MAVRVYNDIHFENATYVDITAHWRRLRPVFESDAARNIWEPCLQEFRISHSMEHGFDLSKSQIKFDGPNARPCWYDGSDWRLQRRARKWWDYACGYACHWIADLALFVARAKFPKENWRIVTSQKHSTVWNGNCENPLLFDINFSALGVEASEALALAAKGRELKAGIYLKGYLHLTEN